MRRLPRTGIAALAAVGFMLTPGIAAAGPASETGVQGWNCREVKANDIRFFANSTGDATTYPHKLYFGQRFRSHGGYNGRFQAETWGPTYFNWGYTTSDSTWVKQVEDWKCM